MLTTAWQSVDYANIPDGGTVVVLGLGPIGDMAARIADHLGYRVIAVDLFQHPQHMWIMNLVWPITALYAGPLAVWAYYAVGRPSSEVRVRAAEELGEEPPGRGKPFWQTVGLAASHCGAGCTLGVAAFVHYGVTMGEGAVLEADSFLMKGEEITPHARWGGNPARELRDVSAD